MKTTRIFAAAVALLSVLSCQKEEQQTINNSENEGGAIITCTFAGNDAATKTTTTDGKTPLWAAGDEIMLYDGSSQTQKLTLKTSGTASSTEGIIDGTDAKNFTFVKPSGWTNVYAIYPYSACVTGFSASAPKINFAGQDGTFAKANICAAAEVSGTMSFKNVGAILKFPSKPANVTDILIPVAGLAKDYTVSFSGATPSLTPVDATNSKSYSIGSGTGVIYIGVPAGEEIAKGSAVVYKDASSIQGCYLTGAANTPAANKIYTLPAIEANGKLPGVFTVGAASGDYTGKVQFSKGNLQATVNASGTPTVWNFAADQYGYIGDAVANTSIGSKAGVVDLFGWSTEATSNNWGIHTKNLETTNWTDGDFKNWGGNVIANGGNTADLWKTLTKDEWSYLLKTRSGDKAPEIDTQTDARYAEVKVNGVCGMLIFPDTFTWPEDITTSKPTTFNARESNWNNVNYTAAEFVLLEFAGCVFLPAAGHREGSSMDGVGSYGRYWSATLNSTSKAYCLNFSNSTVAPANNYYRYYGISVRLVCAAQ